VRRFKKKKHLAIAGELAMHIRNNQENILGLSRGYLVFVFAAALVVRVLCMLVLKSWELPNQWEFGWEIGKIGRSLVSGQGFSIGNIPTAKFPPVYPFLVSGVFLIFGVYSKAAAVVLFLFQSICAAITAVCLVVIGNRFLGRNEGIIAGLIWVFYPSSIFHSVVRVWYSELAIMLLLFLIIIACTPQPYPLFPRVAGVGFVSGMLILTDSAMTIYPALLILLMLHAWKVGLWRCLGFFVIWCVAAGILVTPWGIRNYRVLGTSAILKSNFGLELFFGNNPYSTGGGIDKERNQALEALNKEEHAHYRAQSEYVYFGYLQNKALEWIRMHPLRFLQLTAKRFWYFWGKFPKGHPDIWSKRSWLQFLWYAPLAALALCGFCYSIKRRWNLMPIWLFLLVYPLPYYVTHVQLYRYRYPVEPFIVLLATIPIVAWFGRCWGLMKKETKYH
jgi:hypothetical protein